MKPEQLLSVLAALNGYLAAGEAAYLLGKTIIGSLKSAGVSSEEAQVEIAKFRAHLEAASQKNVAWLDSHPRTVEG